MSDTLFPWENGEEERSGSEADGGVEAGIGSEADSGSGAEAVAGTEAGTEADAAADTELRGETATPAEPEAHAGTEAVAAGEPDVGTQAEASADDDARFDVLDTEYARKAAERASAALREKPVAQKEYYAISEVCELVGLKPHVLRYWESQFPVLNPSKNRSGNRVYQRKEIRLVMLVKHLLYEEKYTVEGAKAKLDQLRRGGELAEATGAALDRAMLEQLRSDLSELTTLLTLPAQSTQA